MSVVENLQTRLGIGQFAAGLFVDLGKAFDAVDHSLQN